MGRLIGMFGARTVSALVERARQKLAAGRLEDAARVVEKGLLRFPDSSSLLDLRLSIGRARAHKTIRRLEQRIEGSADPLAYEELIDLYRGLDLPDEARRRAEEYAAAHPERDTPHLLLGSLLLDLFLADLQARHGHAAHEHLLRSANLNTMAIQPRLLLAELYFCIDARRSLATMYEALQRMAPETEEMREAYAFIADLADPDHEEPVDGLFERIECEGRLHRDPADWPLSQRRRAGAELDEEALDGAVERLLRDDVVDEIVLLRRDGRVLSHGAPTGMKPARAAESDDGADPQDEAAEDETAGTLLGAAPARTATRAARGTDAPGFVRVVQTVASRVFPQAREFDMGRFRRCAIHGRRGHVIVGRVGHLMVGVRCPRTAAAERVWEHVCQALESVGGRAAA